MKIRFKKSWIVLFAFFCGWISLRAATNHFNVLFIAVDDLRPELGCYGAPKIKSPNMDRLASRGLVFNRAYCQQAFCNPSRASLLTGRRPDTTKVYDLVVNLRETLPDVVTLPQFFKQHGYLAQGIGKIFHNKMDDTVSWSVPHSDPQTEGPIYGAKGRKATHDRMVEARAAGKPWRWEDGVKGPFYDDPEIADNALPDGVTADRAVAALKTLKGKPFFLAVGFHKPHLPFVAPKKYWDFYSEKDLALAPNPFPGKNTPSFALSDWTAELRGYIGIPAVGDLAEPEARKMIHGYYAAISYVDAQIGKVLDEVDRLGLRQNTIVVLWGDHGWHLGDHGLWGKQTNFEKATRAPLIVAVPGQKAVGKKTDALVELVDIYPTLVELCGFSKPDGLEGTSFSPLLKDPKRSWKKAAFSQQPREIPGHGNGMGYTMRTARYRFTEWSVPGQDYRAQELYDYEKDPLENINLADDPNYASTAKKLSEMLHRGWQAALPSSR